jgi:hypothetical protein
VNVRTTVSTIFRTTLLLTQIAPANGQTTEQAAREQARDAVRSELHSKINFRADQFLGIHRDEELEQSLATVTIGWRAGPEFIYRVSPTGIEIKENAIVYHVATDADFMYIVAVSSVDGSIFRIHGFGLAEFLAEFGKLMAALRVHVASPDQAESLAEFYRKVNPENQESLTPILRLMELKQAAERQCQAVPFDPNKREFEAWWKQAKSLYARAPFPQTASPSGTGYLVEWTVLSSGAPGNCGGAPLRAHLEVGSDGRVGKLSFSPLPKG